MRIVTLSNRNGRYFHMMRTYKRTSTRLARLMVAATLCGLISFTLAQGGAALVDPSSKLYSGVPGEVIATNLRLSNPGPIPIRLRLYTSDWRMGITGSFEFFDVGQVERSASTWIDYGDTAVELAAYETRVIPYTLTIPTNVEAGTHWSVIFAEGEPSDPVPGQSAASVTMRVGHVIYVNVPDLHSSGQIVGMFGTPSGEQGGPFTVIAQYLNNGNAAQGVGGNFTLRDDTGTVVMEAPLTRGIVLPHSERAFQISVNGPLPAGFYTALVVLNYGDEERDVAGTFDFLLAEPLAEPVMGD